MTQTTIDVHGVTVLLTGSDFATMADSFQLSLEARNRSPNTITIYRYAVDGLGRFLVEQGMPTDLLNIRREHVEAYLAALLRTHSPGTALNYYKSLQAFFKWAVDEDEITVSPMARMHAPTVPDNPPPVIDPEQLKALLKATEGRGFEERRDRALLWMLIDTGVRRAELASITVQDVDMPMRSVKVTGKGNRTRSIPLGAKSAQALDRYLRVRDSSRWAELPNLWLGARGAITIWGVTSILKKRGKKAGLGEIHPHLLRHTFAHQWRLNHGDDDALMQIAGWRSREMLNKYGRSAAAERARVAQRRLSLGDRL